MFFFIYATNEQLRNERVKVEKSGLGLREKRRHGDEFFPLKASSVLRGPQIEARHPIHS